MGKMKKIVNNNLYMLIIALKYDKVYTIINILWNVLSASVYTGLDLLFLKNVVDGVTGGEEPKKYFSLLQ